MMECYVPAGRVGMICVFIHISDFAISFGIIVSFCGMGGRLAVCWSCFPPAALLDSDESSMIKQSPEVPRIFIRTLPLQTFSLQVFSYAFTPFTSAFVPGV